MYREKKEICVLRYWFLCKNPLCKNCEDFAGIGQLPREQMEGYGSDSTGRDREECEKNMPETPCCSFCKKPTTQIRQQFSTEYY